VPPVDGATCPAGVSGTIVSVEWDATANIAAIATEEAVTQARHGSQSYVQLRRGRVDRLMRLAGDRRLDDLRAHRLG